MKIKIIIKNILKLLGLIKANKLVCEIYQNLNPQKILMKNGKVFKIYCPNRLTLWRADTFFTKEPDTIEWIDGFDKQDIFIDIGANIGLYSLYAAHNDIKVFAFEPESLNYSLLNRNIYLNNFTDRITALNIAFSNKSNLEYLFLPEFISGGALNNVGENIDFNKNKFKYDFRQGIITYTLDDFLSRFQDVTPNHIKIDVDGLEYEIVVGAIKTFSNKKLKSILIELNENLETDHKVIEIIKSCGFTLKQKKKSPITSDNYKYILNYIFVKAL